MPVLRHLKRNPAPCRCAVCHFHKTNYKTQCWMRANPKKVTYLAEGVSTDRYNNFNNAPTKKKSKK